MMNTGFTVLLMLAITEEMKGTHFLSDSESLLLLELLLLLLLWLSALSDLSVSDMLSSEYMSDAFSLVFELLDFSSGCSPSSSSPSMPSFSSSRRFSCSIRCCFSFSSGKKYKCHRDQKTNYDYH
jgi:hypothetical protein